MLMKLIAFGANLSSDFGTPEQTLYKALEVLPARGVGVLRVSSLWLSAHVPISDQPWYHNGVAEIDASFDPHGLLKVLKSIEEEFGRVTRERNAARVLDLDILAFDDVVMDGDSLQIPHPRAHERAFVLYPLNEIAPDWVHPVSGLTPSQMIADLPEGQEIKKKE